MEAWQRLGVPAKMGLALAGLGDVAASRGAAYRAGQLFGAVGALLRANDPLLRVIVPSDLATRQDAARSRGDAAAFDRGLAEGRGWDVDTAVAAGLAMSSDEEEKKAS